MSAKTKWEAIRLAIYALAVLVLATLGVMRYGAMLASINWPLVAIICLIALGGYMMYRWNTRDNNAFDVLDLITTDDRADPTKLAMVFFAGVSAWVIIQKVLNDPHGDITALLTIVLGTFVAKGSVDRIADAIANRPAAPSQDTNLSVLQGAQIAPAAPAPAEAATDVAPVKGTAADLRKSAAALRKQVAKDEKVFRKARP